MIRRPRLLLGLALAALAGCGYGFEIEPPKTPGVTSNGIMRRQDAQTARRAPAPASAAPGEEAPTDPGSGIDLDVDILETVFSLIETAPINPGGTNFGRATELLNQYFDRAPDAEYRMSPAAREYLLGGRIPADGLRTLEAREFTMRDARHIEDCLLYRSIATRAAGNGDDLERVRRAFGWVVRHVQLVPQGSLGLPQLPQAEARPYDVALRGMATEEGGWAERSWLFMALCRQLGIDAGLVAVAPPDPGRAQAPGTGPVIFAVAALIDGTPYLFDARIGLEVPGPDGTGVATLDQAAADDRVLARLDLPGLSPYPITRAALAGGELIVLLDSSTGYLSPRMRMLERELAGKYRTVLYRDPAEQRDRFLSALGGRKARVELWDLPLRVETLLFTSPQFVQATQFSLQFFDGQLPLLYARVAQLRGELKDAIKSYIAFRYAENPTLRDKKTPIPPELQRALDLYSTYFLGLAHLERGDASNAEFFFKEVLRLFPAAAPGHPYFNMFRWGAAANLGRLAEQRGDAAEAVRHYVQDDPTPQEHGNLLRARALVWPDPTAPAPEPLPPPPPEPGPAGPQAARAPGPVAR